MMGHFRYTIREMEEDDRWFIEWGCRRLMSHEVFSEQMQPAGRRKKADEKDRV
ncbi:MAG: hypothetical protein PHU95_07270 [Candidatus Thermoplasmatota archaeon]|nr:hypothetical protein [Candidatus Thermoplasmatota archaeon]